MAPGTLQLLLQLVWLLVLPLELYGTREFKSTRRPEDQIINEALAIYQIAYKKAQTDGKVEKCGFAWKVAGSVLCKYYASQDDDCDVFYVSPKMVHELFGVRI